MIPPNEPKEILRIEVRSVRISLAHDDLQVLTSKLSRKSV